jgi:hypothetical protein
VSVGKYIVNFATAMPDVNYAVVTGVNQSNAITTKVQNGTQMYDFLTGSVTVLTGTINEATSNLTDFTGVFTAVFR